MRAASPTTIRKAFRRERRSAVLQLTNVELAQLRMRVIALENLMIALLAVSPDRKRNLARDMAAYISPRAGFTRHPLTLRAARRMLRLVERAGRISRVAEAGM
jgi:hypothetical protein